MSEEFDPVLYENQMRKNIYNSYNDKIINKSEGENLQYLKIKLYRNGKFIQNFSPNLINPKSNSKIIFPSDFEIDREELNKTIFKKKVLDSDDINDMSEDIKLVENLNKTMINTLRFRSDKKDDIQEIVGKNILYLVNAFLQPNTIIRIDGVDIQIKEAQIIDMNENISNSIINNLRSERIVKSYKKFNQDYYIKLQDYEPENSNIVNKFSNIPSVSSIFKFQDKEKPGKSKELDKENPDVQNEIKLTQENPENIAKGGYNFYVAVNIVISKDKVLKKSKFKGIISPFASCKTKRAALSEILDYNINLFESEYLKIDKTPVAPAPVAPAAGAPSSSAPAPGAPSASAPAAAGAPSAIALPRVKGGRKRKSIKIKKIKKKVSRKRKKHLK